MLNVKRTTPVIVALAITAVAIAIRGQIGVILWRLLYSPVTWAVVILMILVLISWECSKIRS